MKLKVIREDNEIGIKRDGKTPHPQEEDGDSALRGK